MNPILLTLLGWWTALSARFDRDDRGDVPGWVLVTVMTVALVAGIWTIAETELRQMLRSALNSVQ
ncbi:hypothetical protein KUV85_00750 [Nocardioides panacisoli]|uniref:hypothetical protein n=1 Tax=Nocardioides panacisoli TaxID=627624 RepID=UPI001C634A20|nr:hypothetical protein [Nocardioides panacisoli]QYJ04243.1 hypothetical protein KUV85_00750 [Nocardioides panacisoli]